MDHGAQPAGAGPAGARPAGTRPVIVALCGDDDRLAGMEPVEALGEVRYTGAAGLAEALRGAEVLFVWDFRSDALRTAWDAADALRWVHVAGAGVDKVLFPELVASDVVVTNSRGVFDRPMSEYVLGLILAFAKDLPTTLRSQQAAEWNYRETEDIAGKRVVIAGTGSIGRTIARMLRAVGMEVHGVGRTVRATDPDFGSVSASADLPEVVRDADYVVAVAPLTEQTRHMINADVLRAMPSTARLINVGRGLLVDDTALLTALDAGEIAGAALDAFAEEPLPPDHPYWRHPRVIVSPHMSGDSIGWDARLIGLFASNLRSWLAGEPLRNVIDKHSGFAATPAGDERTGVRDG